MALIACFLGIVLCAADIIRPEDRLSSQIKFVFSAVFILAFLSPLKDFSVSDFEEYSDTVCENTENNDFEKAAVNELKELICRNTSAAVNELLENNGIYSERTETVADITDEGKVNIIKIKIDTDRINAAEKILKNEFGDEVIIEKNETAQN